MSRKQLIYVFIGVVGLLLFFVIFLAFQQSTQTATPKVTAVATQAPAPQTADGGTNFNGKTAAKPTALPQQQLNAAQTAQAFYNLTAVGNPLANGAFKTNPYLSDTFKHTLKIGYKNGNTPVFCRENRRPQVTVGKEQQVYYNQGYITQETLSDPNGGKDLYLVMLENTNNAWHILDITCL